MSWEIDDARYLIAALYSTLRTECETTVVLLMMLLNPHPLHIKKQYSSILQKYVWSEEKVDCCQSASEENENFFILMQSLVVCIDFLQQKEM